MEHSSRAFARPSSTVHRIAQWRDDRRVAQSADTDLELARTRRVNLLIVGSEGVVRNMLDMVLADLPMPIHHRAVDEPLALPAAVIGTLILRDVDTLTVAEQCALLAWIERSTGRTQVVSTTTTPLLARVLAGRFLEPLYYRLNTVFVDARA
jgi:hypothetical protein